MSTPTDHQTAPAVDLTAPLDELLDAARERFDVAFQPLTIGETTLDILQIADMADYVDRIAAHSRGESIELPFWAKLWQTSILLGYFVQRLPAEGKSLLDIGAGIGVCGLFAAAHGFRTVITDIHPDALLFTQISILKNGLDDRAGVRRVDFTTDRLEERFDYVIGSEVLYKEDNYRPLVKFLLAHLKNTAEAEAVLAKTYGRTAKKFFTLAEKEFQMASKTVGFKATGDEDPDKHLCTIHRLRAKKHA